MLHRFVPTWQSKSIYSVPASEWHRAGIDTILTDFDNTLIAWNQPAANRRLHEWVAAMHAANIRVVVVSNNNHRRLKKALNEFNIPFVSRALKPLGVGINQAIKEFKLDKAHTVMVGDQLLTDILAANRVGVRSLLVAPLVESDAKATKFNRLFERLVKRRLILRGKINQRWEKSLNDCNQ